MLFQSVIGQTYIKQKLLQTVQDGRVSHAQLFWGTEGSGNLPLALAYAQYLNCTRRTETDSCGVCPSCNKVQKFIHPDLHFVFPIFNKKKNSSRELYCDDLLPQWRSFMLQDPYASLPLWLEYIAAENAQGTIYAREADAITRKLSLKAYESEYKIMVIWLPENMHPTAANKLLKLVEEPPDKTVFLFVSEDPNRIIKTILSRTMPVHIPPIDKQSLVAVLEQRNNLPATEAAKVAHIAEGSYSQALLLIQSTKEAKEFFEWFAFIMRNAYTANFLELLEWMEELAKAGREKQKNFLLYAQRMLRESFMMNRGTDSIVYLMDEESQFARKFSPFVNERNVEELFREFNLAEGHIAQNGNPKIVFTDMFLKIGKLLRK
ncbi:MAG: DNA polymerase III subunit delta [Prevotellaceae bacterium]|jgi:DNA polymerase-3 subunit delta'|nr:DNA polymerase III subunit delta [Prevotellaceae bacterium]